MADAVTSATQIPIVSQTGIKPEAAQGQPSSPTGVNGEKPTAEEQYYEHKVNGQMRRYTLPELLSKVGLADAAMSKMEEAANITKKERAFKENLKKDFLTAIQDPELGLSREQIKQKFEQWYKENFIDPEMMSEEQKELTRLKKEKAQWELEQDKRQQEQQAELQAQLDFETVQNLQKEIITALEKSDLPKTSATVARMAYWMRQNLSKGYDAPMETIIQQVKDEDLEVFSRNVKARPIEKIIELLGGEAFINSVRKYDLERLKQKFGASEAPIVGSKSERGNGKKKNWTDVEGYFNKLRQQKQ